MLNLEIPEENCVSSLYGSLGYCKIKLASCLLFLSGSDGGDGEVQAESW